MPDEQPTAEGERVWPKKGDFNYNLNTLLLLGGLVLWAAGIGILYQTQISADREVQQWIIRHEAQHKERQAQVEANSARTDERLRKLENDALKLETLQYRITVNETAAVNIAKVLDELKLAVSDQAADLRVIREVLVPGSQTKRR